MESPVKKLNFAGAADKENQPFDAALDSLAQEIEANQPIKPVIEEAKTQEVAKPTPAEIMKAQEAEEPLLQENPNRFVLFPIKYHEVRVSRNASLQTRRVVTGVNPC